MVTRYKSLLCSLTLLVSIVSAPSAHAESLLERLQDEIATMMRQTRGAVVSIEDIRKDVAAQATTNTALAQDESELKYLEARTIQTQLEKDSLTAKLAQMRATFADEHPKVRETLAAIQSHQDLLATLERKRQELAQQRSLFLYSAAPRSGSGFSIGEGYIVTTADVVEGLVEVVVVTDDHKRLKAKLVGTDSGRNVGLLRLEAKIDLPALALGDSDKTQVGHLAFSCGNLSGQENSLSLLLISGIRQKGMYAGTRFYPHLFQLAGTLGDGTSGSPLLNVRGEVIGIVAALASDMVPATMPTDTLFNAPVSTTSVPGAPTQGISLFQEVVGSPFPPQLSSPTARQSSQAVRPSPKTRFPGQPQSPASQQAPLSVSFSNRMSSHEIAPLFMGVVRPAIASAGYAISINTLKPTITALRAGKKIEATWLGVDLEQDDKTFEENGVFVTQHRVKVRGVYEGSPAAKGGLLPGDILVALVSQKDTPTTETTFKTSEDVRSAVLQLQPGETIRLVVQRVQAGQLQTHTCSLKVEARPAEIKQGLIVAPAPEKR